MYAIRWQSAPAGIDVGHAVRSATVVDLADLPAAVGTAPKGTVTSEQRAGQLADRASDYRQRLTN